MLTCHASLLALAWRDIAGAGVDDSLFRPDRSGPTEPLVGAVFASVTILEDEGVLTCGQIISFRDGRVAIFGVNEIDIWMR